MTYSSQTPPPHQGPSVLGERRHASSQSSAQSFAQPSMWMRLLLPLAAVAAVALAFSGGVMIGKRDARLRLGACDGDAPAAWAAKDVAPIQVDAQPSAKPEQKAAAAAESKEAQNKADTDAGLAQLYADLQAPLAPPAPRAAKAVLPRAKALLPQKQASAPTSPSTPSDVSAGAIEDADRASPYPSLHQTTAERATQSPSYAVQVMAFQEREEAQAYAASLKRRGYAPYLREANIADKGVWHRVRLGRFASAKAASLAQKHLLTDDIGGYVVQD